MIVAIAAGCAACTPFDINGSTRGAAQEVGTFTAPAPRGGPFGRASAWKTPIAQAPSARNSKRMVAHLLPQITGRYGGVAAFNVNQYNASFYTVSGDHTRVNLKWDDCQGRGGIPKGLYGPGGQFVGVPVPSRAVPATGTDSALTVYQPATDTMWDFWRAVKRDDGWHACWGGRIDRVSTSKGNFRSKAFGASASGLSVIGGAIGIQEARAGRIDHALALAIPNPAAVRFSWPAQRTDGFDHDAHAIPLGTRLRLDPKLDLRRYRLHPLARMVAKAAQRYGFIVTDKSGAVAVVTENGAATKAATGTDPWVALLDGTPDYLVMKNFPWRKLQALPQNYGKPR